jgi:hypothetical protein
VFICSGVIAAFILDDCCGRKRIDKNEALALKAGWMRTELMVSSYHFLVLTTLF